MSNHQLTNNRIRLKLPGIMAREIPAWNLVKAFAWSSACPVFLAISVLGWLGAGCSPTPAPSESAPLTSTNAPATNAPPPQARSEFRILPGKWARTDGDYILEILRANADGTLEARYFNPRPINVYAARATQEGSTTQIFVELRDEGYPGCTYTLIHHPGIDQLVGTYYQAAIQQNYDVAFQRLK